MPDADEPEEITLEEWIASTQSCCGVEPESRCKPKPAPADDAPHATEPKSDAPPTP